MFLFNAPAYLSRDFNVVMVNWQRITFYPCYFSALSNTKLVGQCTAQVNGFFFYFYKMIINSFTISLIISNAFNSDQKVIKCIFSMFHVGNGFIYLSIVRVPWSDLFLNCEACSLKLKYRWAIIHIYIQKIKGVFYRSL